MKRVHLKIVGIVQGVGFRTWSVNIAQTLNIVGWVKNTHDRDVEIIAEGKKADLDLFISSCHHGPDGAQVTTVDINWEQTSGEFKQFSVVY